MGFFDFLFKKPSVKNTGTGKLLYEKINDYTVIDLETSSKYSNKAHIIELAAVKVRNSKIVNTFDVLIKPPEPIAQNISALTGITNEMVASAPTIEQVIGEYINFIGNDIIIGHNIRSFDCNVINTVCSRLNRKPMSNDMIDTLHYSRKCEIKVYNYRLTTLARYFKIEFQAHRAINDCLANFNVYENLKRFYNGVYHKPLDRTKQSAANMKSCMINANYSDLNEKSVVLTGDFEIAEIEDIENKLTSLGAQIKRDVNGKTDYLIIGSLGHSQWYYGSYGRKIEKALELQNQGKKVLMIEEWDFFILPK